MTDQERIKKLMEALEPFAQMDRKLPGFDDLKEVACQRGWVSDMTIITSQDFRRAAEVLKEVE